jgi:hypothetical protein
LHDAAFQKAVISISPREAQIWSCQTSASRLAAELLPVQANCLPTVVALNKVLYKGLVYREFAARLYFPVRIPKITSILYKIQDKILDRRSIVWFSMSWL